ncbi:MAG: chemotaxis protein CheW [Alphaproteobacteria bacterium]|nr:chemotaxis protein CheW [Alphaproteobacteria bacterium]
MMDAAADKIATMDGVEQVLAVYLGNEMFGLPIAQMQGVLETLPLTFVPLAPPAVRGVMNLRGRIVTAVDLRTLLGLAERPGVAQANMSVVIENGGELFSLLVDSVGDVHTIPVANVEEPPLTMPESMKRVSSGVFPLRDRIMILLKPSVFLKANEE